MVNSAHATTVPLLVPLLLLDDVVGAGVAAGEGVAGAGVDDDEEDGAGVCVGDGVLAESSSSDVTARLFLGQKIKRWRHIRWKTA